jgi:hypothetical protein
MGIMAAPNRSRITARVASVERVPNQPKWYLTVEVLDAHAREGGLFVHTGDSTRVFVIGDEPGLEAGDVFRAEVEYLGGPGGGELQLHELLQSPAPPDEETQPG